MAGRTSVCEWLRRTGAGRVLKIRGEASVDIPLRILLAAVSFVTMFHPSETVAWLTGVVVLAATVAGIWRHRVVAPPKELVAAAAAPVPVPEPDLAALVAEAKREV